MARTSLAVDKPLREGTQSRVLEVEGTTLVCRIRARDVRVLRIAVQVFLDTAGVVTRAFRDLHE